MLGAAATLLAAAAPALSGVTVTGPSPQGTTLRTLPAITLKSNRFFPTIDWAIAGPSFSDSGSGSPGSSTATVPAHDTLGGDGVYTLSATDDGGLTTFTMTFTVDRTPPVTPTVTSGPPAITGASSPFTFTWTIQDAASSHWQLLDTGLVIAEGTVPAPTAQVAVAPTLAPGDRILNFRVSLLDSLLNPSLFAGWAPFVVDQTPPPAPTGLAKTSPGSLDLTPTFAWAPTEFGATFEWDVTDSTGASIFGPGTAPRTTGDVTITTPRLPLAPNLVHHLVFRVRQIDPQGNRGPQALVPFAITTVAPGPATYLAKFMRPAAGNTLAILRPRLTWRRLYAGTTFSNLQIYAGKRKVLSAFPPGNTYRVPPGKLKRGTRYTWIVWAYRGAKKGYVTRPMTSYFGIAR